MTCKKCGAELADDELFCTECGQRAGEDVIYSDAKQKFSGVSKEKIKNYSFKLDKLISTYGETDILKFTVYAGLLFLLSIRIIGFMLTSILLTIVNGYLIFSKYRRNKNLDMKMLMLTLLVLCVGIICSII